MCFFHCVKKVVLFNFSGEGKDDAGYMDVFVSELKHPPPQLCPMPEGLSSQQVCVWMWVYIHLRLCIGQVHMPVYQTDQIILEGQFMFFRINF